MKNRSHYRIGIDLVIRHAFFPRQIAYQVKQNVYVCMYVCMDVCIDV